MRWQGGRKGGNIEDRRGMGPGKVAGGGIGVIIIALIGYFVLGLEPEEVAQIVGDQSAGNAASTQEGVRGTPEDEAGQFVDIIGANINDVWSQALRGYRAPTVVLYEQGTGTGCGYGQAAMGPFYCPADQTVYLDLGFWQDMQTQLGASGADFAKAYVIAHEFGHHVQKLTGASDKVRQAQQAARSQEEANAWSIALELQADCYAGVWAAHAAQVSDGAVALEPGDVEEGLRTAQAIGDDMIQKRMTGKVTPEAFTHGTADQRVEWLRRGLTTGDPNACDTFSQ
ncbi:neutral zinc metallopeptidase [Hyphomonas sp.]|jgi:predicted metalloprotease|uniref:KPN_02809 family neutral zinc metallopeptidase n=1 Tax=Hyphomonas sp. TaxID=87 RepID=UPI000C441AF3|nr:neutral zinc metallopeptidase [Hyphomonas sp.]MAU65665.1 flagellar biosynthesis protein FlgM [Hyphomonas sp.]MBM56586.1 flagellar biosynthesis protein FlgM [Hyphomonas sp.]